MLASARRSRHAQVTLRGSGTRSRRPFKTVNKGPPFLATHDEDFHVHMTRLWHHERAPVKLGAATRSPSTTTTAPTSPSTWQLGGLASQLEPRARGAALRGSCYDRGQKAGSSLSVWWAAIVRCGSAGGPRPPLGLPHGGSFCVRVCALARAPSVLSVSVWSFEVSCTLGRPRPVRACAHAITFTPRDRLYSQLHTASHFQAMQSDVTGSSIAEGGSGPAEAAAITAMPVEVELGAAEPSPARSSEDGTHV